MLTGDTEYGMLRLGTEGNKWPGGNTMAKPIKDTPILEGNEAAKFLARVKENETKKIPDKEYDRVVAVYEEVIKKNKGNL
jgi:hypothetical protein